MAANQRRRHFGGITRRAPPDSSERRAECPHHFGRKAAVPHQLFVPCVQVPHRERLICHFERRADDSEVVSHPTSQPTSSDPFCDQH